MLKNVFFIPYRNMNVIARNLFEDRFVLVEFNSTQLVDKSALCEGAALNERPRKGIRTFCWYLNKWTPGFYTVLVYSMHVHYISFITKCEVLIIALKRPYWLLLECILTFDAVHFTFVYSITNNMLFILLSAPYWGRVIWPWLVYLHLGLLLEHWPNSSGRAHAWDYTSSGSYSSGRL